MIGSFTLCAQSISVVALAINVFLIVIYFKCPLKRVREYRYFFLMTAIQDTLLALCCLFLTPITISRESTVVFMATGILHKKPIGEVAIIFFCTVFIVSILIVANSFIYRYIHLCRNEIAHIYQSEKWLALMIAINIIIIINWLCMVLCGNGREATVQYDINPTAVRLSGLNVNETGLVGFHLAADMNKLTLILLCENWSVMFVLLAVGCFCALQIAHTLRKSSISKNARKYHGQMFTLLLLQTACPAILMQAPVGLMYVMLFTGTSSTTTMTIVIGILLALFPVFDPIILIVFLKDYRNYILARVGLRRFERSVSPSARHTFVGTHGTHA
ncbi:hypothetical protein Y032_0095g2801 [Ancylostoma ceylanicum]|nr:hypothetical protein Y032_0095g2801 [Ancylostoma ceylanicum]